MKTRSFGTAYKLSTALKQCHQAQKNLKAVELNAHNHADTYLEIGTTDLAERLASAAADLRTLIQVVEAQSASDKNLSSDGVGRPR